MSELATIKTEEITGDYTLDLAAELYREDRPAEARELLAGRDDLGAVLLTAKTYAAEKRFADGLELLERKRGDFAAADDRTRARFHAALGALLRDLARADAAYLDRALLEYEAAIFHQEKVEDFYDAGSAENNVGLVLAQLGRFDEARAHFGRARKHLKGRAVKLAEVDDSEAEMCLAEGKSAEALHLSLNACAVFEAHGEKRLLVAALITLQKAIADCRWESAKESAA